MELVLISVIVVGLAMVAMSVGMLFSNRCLRGSCGGPEVLGPDGESLTCATCPHRPTEIDSDETPPVPLGSGSKAGLSQPPPISAG